MKLVPYLTPLEKITRNGINDLNIRPETITPRRKHKRKSLAAIWQWFNGYEQKEEKQKICKQDNIKLKSFCTEKGRNSQNEMQSTEWEKIFAY